LGEDGDDSARKAEDMLIDRLAAIHTGHIWTMASTISIHLCGDMPCSKTDL